MFKWFACGLLAFAGLLADAGPGEAAVVVRGRRGRAVVVQQRRAVVVVRRRAVRVRRGRAVIIQRGGRFIRVR